VREIRELLADLPFAVVSAAELSLPEPEETGSTFAENATIKAEAAAQATGCLALSDDSGLAIPALDGAPGIYSARWAGPEKDFAVAMAKVAERLEESGADDRFAWFTCALAVAWPHGPMVVVEGRVEGVIAYPPRGAKGFGYDPIFMPDGHDLTFGEMDPALKESMSHRTRAFEQLRAALF
jgi:XTP/dITP diphosphohydrolase